MTQNKHIVVVCGYDCKLNVGVLTYLDRVIQFCKKNEPDLIIFSGGYTQQKTFPKQSEADRMAEYVMQEIHGDFLAKASTYYPEAITERDSYTTLENIQNVAALLERWQISGAEKLTIFCETGNALSVDLLARHIMHRAPNIEAVHWQRESPETLILHTIVNWAMMKTPLLARLIRRFLVRRAKNR